MAKQDQPSEPKAETTLETKNFTEAEAKVFKKKSIVFNEAMADVNEFIEFLKEQHGIDSNGGWQLADSGFVRRVPVVPADAPDVTKGKSKSKKKVAEPEIVEDVIEDEVPVEDVQEIDEAPEEIVELPKARGRKKAVAA